VEAFPSVPRPVFRLSAVMLSPRPRSPLLGDSGFSGLCGNPARLAGGQPMGRAALGAPRANRTVCRGCGESIRFGRSYCASCAVTVSKEGLMKAAQLGRVAAHSREARARQAEKQRRHAAAKRAWRPSDQPAWLDQQTYLQKIQPRLAGVTIPVIASALGLSEPYAAEIRAGRRRPHPRHWQTLARIVGVSPDE
jgi:hypothetical protein